MKKQQATVKEAAKLAGKSVNTIRIWIKAKKVNAVKADGSWLIDVDSLKAVAGKKKTTKKAPRKSVKTAMGRSAEARGKEEKLENEISALKNRLARIEQENERLRENEERLHQRIRKVFGPVVGPLVERALEIE